MFEEEKEEKKKSKVYSHSKLWLYEHCPEAYKIKYIDKKFPELPKSIEAFLGDMVHQSLDWFYTELLKANIVSLDDFIHQFIQNWKSSFSKELRINHGLDENHYFNKGIDFLIKYHQKNKPFSDNTIATEKEFFFDLDEQGECKIRGFIDRIVYNKEDNEYEVHDYKTNDWLKSQEEIDADKQLAFYHLGINGLFGKQERVKLIWHFLAHNKKMESRRTLQELEQLKKETFLLIKKIESTISWPACGKKWCDWCEYKRLNGLIIGDKMEIIFETTDKSGRKTYLSKERLKHIQKHPHMHDPIDNIELTLKNPTTIRYFEEDKNVRYFYREFKQMGPKERYLLVSIKYLNGEGFIITSFFTNKITGEKWI